MLIVNGALDELAKGVRGNEGREALLRVRGACEVEPTDIAAI